MDAQMALINGHIHIYFLKIFDPIAVFAGVNVELAADAVSNLVGGRRRESVPVDWSDVVDALKLGVVQGGVHRILAALHANYECNVLIGLRLVAVSVCLDNFHLVHEFRLFLVSFHANSVFVIVESKGFIFHLVQEILVKSGEQLITPVLPVDFPVHWAISNDLKDVLVLTQNHWEQLLSLANTENREVFVLMIFGGLGILVYYFGSFVVLVLFASLLVNQIEATTS